MRGYIVSLALMLMSTAAFAQTAPADTASTGANYIEGATWTYPSLSDILSISKQRLGAYVNVDCAIKFDGHVKDCSVIPLSEGIDAEMANAIKGAYQQRAVVDPKSIDGGIQPGDRVRFIYNFNHLPESDVADASSLPDLSQKHSIAGNWTFPNANVMIRNFPERAANDHIGDTLVLSCDVASDGSIPSCQLLADLEPSYGFASATVNLFIKYAHVDPASVGGGIPEGANHLFTYNWPEL